MFHFGTRWLTERLLKLRSITQVQQNSITVHVAGYIGPLGIIQTGIRGIFRAGTKKWQLH